MFWDIHWFESYSGPRNREESSRDIWITKWQGGPCWCDILVLNDIWDTVDLSGSGIVFNVDIGDKILALYPCYVGGRRGKNRRIYTSVYYWATVTDVAFFLLWYVFDPFFLLWHFFLFFCLLAVWIWRRQNWIIIWCWWRWKWGGSVVRPTCVCKW